MYIQDKTTEMTKYLKKTLLFTRYKFMSDFYKEENFVVLFFLRENIWLNQLKFLCCSRRDMLQFFYCILFIFHRFSTV